MNWEEKALELLDSKLGAKAFTTGEAARLLSKGRDFSAGTTYRLIHDLVETGKLVKLGRGVYRLPRKSRITTTGSVGFPSYVPTLSISDTDEIAKRVLSDRGIKFMITGPSLLFPFIHHFPRKMIHLIYVIRGAGENAMEGLREAGLRCLLRPSRAEINLGLTEFPETDLFIIRETVDIGVPVNGAAVLERALVDTYFETTRRRIPLAAEEFGRMAANVFATSRVSVSHLLMLAGRRGVRPELRTVLENLLPGLALSGVHVENEHVERVLKGIASAER